MIPLLLTLTGALIAGTLYLYLRFERRDPTLNQDQFTPERQIRLATLQGKAVHGFEKEAPHV